MTGVEPTLASGLAGQIAIWLAQTGINYLELRGPNQDLRLLQRDGQVGTAPTGWQSLTCDRTVVTAPFVGKLRCTHPLHPGPLVVPGQAVEAGQTVVLLQVGPLLLPVPAPRNGVFAAMLGEDGSVVGYGTPLFEYWPTADAGGT